MFFFFFFSSRRRHTRYWRDWSSDVCSSDLGHHLRDDVAPTLVMPGVFVRGGCRFISVDLHEYDMCRILAIAEHVESHYARLLTTCHGVFLSRVEEALELIRHDRDVHMDDKQAGWHELTISTIARTGLGSFSTFAPLRIDHDPNGSIADPGGVHQSSTKHGAQWQAEHQSPAAEHSDDLQDARKST